MLVPLPVPGPDAAGRVRLPAPPLPLIGRAAEVAAVRALLATPDVRLVTLTGAPGIGKTRLATEIAAVSAPAFPGGVVFVPLAPIRDPDLLLPTIARALGAKRTVGRTAIEAIRAALDGRRTLLALDNFEQIAAAAAHLAELLAACPSLVALVTSRSVLHLRGEDEYRVPPLALPDPDHLPPVADLAQCAAVALFLRCARTAVPDFCLTAANAPAVAAICVRLDGLPLAIELAAPRLKLFAPVELLRRLERRLVWLTNGPRDLPTRQRTLRDAIAWSDELLAPAERALFRRLAVFAGGWTLNAAVAVGATPGEDAAERAVVDGIAALLDKSLLHRSVPPDGEPRFAMLETVREYGAEQLAASGEERDARRRHADYYATLAARAEPHLYGAEQAVWVERLEREHDNLRAALRWLLERGDGEAALRIVGNVQNFWIVHDHLREGQQWAEATLAATAETPTPARARALAATATFALRLGDYDRARTRRTQTLEASRALGDDQLTAQTLLDLGSVASVTGDSARAAALFTESLALARRIGDARTEARALNQLGEIARHSGDDTGAAAHYEASLRVWRTLGEKERIAMALHNLGPVAHRRGDVARAIEALTESIGLSWELRHAHGAAICLFAIAGVVAVRGRAADAARLLGAADALRAAIGVRWEPVDRAEYERSVAAASARLDALAFAAARAEGTAMTLGTAVACARDALVHCRTDRARPSPDPTAPDMRLTRREREIAALVAQGMSNREIAQALFIAEKTVEMHVSNSLGKLGFRSRAQLAAWVVSQNTDSPVPPPTR